MDVLTISSGDKIPGSMLKKYGGRYTFIARMFYKLIISPDIIYQRGVEEFQDLISETHDTNFSQFELLRKGLIIRLFQKERQLIALISRKEIKKILLDAFQVEKENKVQFSGNIKIETKDKVVRFFVPVKSFNGLYEFFQKSHLKPLFHYHQDEQPPLGENDIALLKVLKQFGKEK